MTFAEWAAFYDKKNPEDPFSPTPGYDLYFMPDKGFCEVRFTKKATIARCLSDNRHRFCESYFTKPLIGHEV